MASQSLKIWRITRQPALSAIDAQCATCSPAAALNAVLMEENLRGYAMHLSAHFQGFCRDLYSNCIDAAVNFFPATTGLMIQAQFRAGQLLNSKNATYETLKTDFGRFGFDPNLALQANPGHANRVTDLGHLNAWRNHAAHSKQGLPPFGPLTLATLRAWRQSCDELATELDAALYIQLSSAFGLPPW